MGKYNYDLVQKPATSLSRKFPKQYMVLDQTGCMKYGKNNQPKETGRPRPVLMFIRSKGRGRDTRQLSR